MIKRGDVWWVDFSSSKGDIRKRRPAIIVSNNSACQYLNRVQVMPMTSNIGKLYPSEAYVTFQGRQSKALADQLVTVSKKRLLEHAGSISMTEMDGVNHAIAVQLDLL